MEDDPELEVRVAFCFDMDSIKHCNCHCKKRQQETLAFTEGVPIGSQVLSGVAILPESLYNFLSAIIVAIQLEHNHASALANPLRVELICTTQLSVFADRKLACYLYNSTSGITASILLDFEHVYTMRAGDLISIQESEYSLWFFSVIKRTYMYRRACDNVT